MKKLISYWCFYTFVAALVAFPISLVAPRIVTVWCMFLGLVSGYYLFRDTLNKLQVVGRFYWIARDNSKAPFISVGFMRELESPWRSGKGIQVTIQRWSFQLGVCKSNRYINELDGQLAAMGGRMLETPPEEIGTW